MSDTGEILIGNIDERFMRYLEINEEKKRIESYVCPVPGCGFNSKQGPGAVRMHTLLVGSKSLQKDESGEYLWAQTGVSSDNPEGFDRQAHLDYFEENNALTLEDVKELARTDTRSYSERDV
jgi:hypothetical protein